MRRVLCQKSIPVAIALVGLLATGLATRPALALSCQSVFAADVSSDGGVPFKIATSETIEAEISRGQFSTRDFHYLIRSDREFSGLIYLKPGFDTARGFLFAGHFKLTGSSKNEVLEVTGANGQQFKISTSLIPTGTTVGILPDGDPKLLELSRRYPVRSDFIDTQLKSRQAFIESFLETGKLFSNPRFFDLVTNSRTDLETLVKRWVTYPTRKMFSVKEYRNKFGGTDHKLTQDEIKKIKSLHRQQLAMITEVRQTLGWKHLSLLLDPAIVNRYSEFRSFLRILTDVPESPFELRQRFSQHLGERTVYRVLAIPDQVASDIAVNGLKNKYLFDPADVARLSNELGAHLNPVNFKLDSGHGPFADFYKKTKLEGDLVVSVTDFPAVGIYATGAPMSNNASSGPGRIATDGLQIDKEAIGRMRKYIIEMRLPVLDISHGAIFRAHPAVPEAIEIGGTKYPFLAPKTESFIFDTVRPEQIVSITPVDQTGPMKGYFVYRNGEVQPLDTYSNR